MNEFDRKAARLRTDIEKFGTSKLGAFHDWRDRSNTQIRLRARIDRLEPRGEAQLSVVETLGRQLRHARDQLDLLVQKWRDAEMQRLDAEIREERIKRRLETPR